MRFRPRAFLVGLVVLFASSVGCGDDAAGNCPDGFAASGGDCVLAPGYAEVDRLSVIGAVVREDDLTSTFYVMMAGAEPDCAFASTSIPEAVLIEVPDSVQPGNVLSIADGAVFQHRADGSLALELASTGTVEVAAIDGSTFSGTFQAQFDLAGSFGGDFVASFCP